MDNTALVYRSFGEPQTVLHAETTALPPLPAGQVRVKMYLAPVNASDLIPVTGAYSHRITLPAIAGYEGVGVVMQTHDANADLMGKRVLPLRGHGTWQQYVDCPAQLAVPVPDDIDDTLAARAYINPLAAQMMLEHYPAHGQHVLVTAAGSDCAAYLAQWARLQGAKSVTGIYRSTIHASRLAACGVKALADTDSAAIKQAAGKASVIYDATGGTLAEMLLQSMPKTGQFISYGLLSGQPFSIRQRLPAVHWFHVRNYLDAMTAYGWQQAFCTLWERLRATPVSEVTLIDFQQWRQAITLYQTPGRIAKPLLSF
ncbi:alcohol dehydrogenase [Kosakonia sacchari]|uniref:zinc-dependent alcohol dehydrogenase family protein n=1 Tax=Kosakonia sacchari TaxID=1158459 RepID=UPI0008074165|nr:zinc-dependent alcohol dehydrogenase family protein [Kosakonia sacchari]ANR77467.1 alcohol dehydrogenase [Kosakonia sacchari]